MKKEKLTTLLASHAVLLEVRQWALARKIPMTDAVALLIRRGMVLSADLEKINATQEVARLPTILRDVPITIIPPSSSTTIPLEDLPHPSRPSLAEQLSKRGAL